MEFQGITREALADLLRSHGIAPTHQRIEIAHVLFERKQHLSAEQILAAVNARHAETSKATVYNTLRLFLEKNLVRELVVDPTRVFYDPNTDAASPLLRCRDRAAHRHPGRGGADRGSAAGTARHGRRRRRRHHPHPSGVRPALGRPPERIREDAAVAQSVERLIRNHEVACSIHASSTIRSSRYPRKAIAASLRVAARVALGRSTSLSVVPPARLLAIAAGLTPPARRNSSSRRSRRRRRRNPRLPKESQRERQDQQTGNGRGLLARLFRAFLLRGFRRERLRRLPLPGVPSRHPPMA